MYRFVGVFRGGSISCTTRAKAAPQPLKHVIHLVGRALHQGFDRAVQQILTQPVTPSMWAQAAQW